MSARASGSCPLKIAPRQAIVSRHPVHLYYGLAFGFTWGVGGLSLLASAIHPAFCLRVG
jgi:hypothetical protein